MEGRKRTLSFYQLLSEPLAELSGASEKHFAPDLAGLGSSPCLEILTSTYHQMKNPMTTFIHPNIKYVMLLDISC